MGAYSLCNICRIMGFNLVGPAALFKHISSLSMPSAAPGGGGGGGGYSHVFFICRLGPSIYPLPQKIYQEFQKKKYLEF